MFPLIVQISLAAVLIVLIAFIFLAFSMLDLVTEHGFRGGIHGFYLVHMRHLALQKQLLA